MKILDVRWGPCGAGKTTFLVGMIPSEKEMCQSTLFITSSVNAIRNGGTGKVFTHQGRVGNWTIRCHLLIVDRLFDISVDDIKSMHRVIIDEAQFYPDLVEWVSSVMSSKSDIEMYVAGLVTNYNGDRFGAISDLIRIATHVEVINTSCVVCEREGIYRQAIYSGLDSNPCDLITAHYIPMCFDHFQERRKILKGE